MQAYKQILVALDLSEDSLFVCRRALDIARDYGANVLLIHVVEFVYQMSIAYDPLFYPAYDELAINEEELIKRAREKMVGLIKELDMKDGSAGTRDKTSLEYEVVSGIPKTEILRIAEEKNADLIVCGSHGRSGFELLLGSTANAILHHAACDVLAVRSRKNTK